MIKRAIGELQKRNIARLANTLYWGRRFTQTQSLANMVEDLISNKIRKHKHCFGILENFTVQFPESKHLKWRKCHFTKNNGLICTLELEPGERIKKTEKSFSGDKQYSCFSNIHISIWIYKAACLSLGVTLFQHVKVNCNKDSCSLRDYHPVLGEGYPHFDFPQFST